ncbi:MAG: DNA repair protein RecO, partial [Gammaproteobacteria bacterium]
MRVDLHSAFVLHQRSYRETSLLLEIFSSRSGRVGLIAKGANRRRSAFRGALQFFRPLLLAWTGRGELATLVSAEIDGPFSALSGRALLSAFYLNEL